MKHAWTPADMPENLHDFITLLESAGELARIKVETDPILEIAAITDRVCKLPGGGKALLFERPGQSKFPVATNLFGSARRVCLALGVENLNHLTGKVAALLENIPKLDLDSLDRQIGTLPEFLQYSPRNISLPFPGQISMDPPDLTAFPFLQSWPGDGNATGHSRYITLPMVFTAGPDGGSGNCGMYRSQVRGTSSLAIQWKSGSGAARHLEQFRQQGKAMPVAIALGGDPAVTFSAMFPLPGDLDEITFAGYLRGKPLDMIACRTVPLFIPAGAEVVIEGYVDSLEMVEEGPFGNHTGFYAPTAPAALLRITAISHRDGAVIPATVVGPPPMEDCWMATAWERILLAFLKRLTPAIAELRFPTEWVFHQSAIISLENPHPDMVRETAALLWNTPWFTVARLLIFVDADTDIANSSGVAWRCINLIDYHLDTIHDSTGMRLALDATGCRLPRPPVAGDLVVDRLVAQRWEKYGIDA